MSEFTHFDAQGQARMVDVSEKPATRREAIAAGEITMHSSTLEKIKKGEHAKGDVLAVARIAAIMGAKQTSDLVPMCHPLGLDSVEVDFRLKEEPPTVEATVTARLTGKTGVEMEALTGVSVALLTIYDMCKAVDRGMSMGNIRLLKKSGGKSGTWMREE